MDRANENHRAPRLTSAPCHERATKLKKPESAKSIRIRRARLGDAERLAELSGQLGYPASRQEIVQRMKRMKPAAHHALFVAEAGKFVAGWLHVSVTPLMEVPLRAEVNGLVIDEKVRSAGGGGKLLEAAEHWAAKKGCKSMSVRSNVIRERAHEFYQRNGYEHYKTQKAFRKPL
jgi:GNAT superfamily N-acetyltransferase